MGGVRIFIFWGFVKIVVLHMLFKVEIINCIQESVSQSYMADSSEEVSG